MPRATCEEKTETHPRPVIISRQAESAAPPVLAHHKSACTVGEFRPEFAYGPVVPHHWSIPSIR